MNKIITKNPLWIELKEEVEEYVSKNENRFLEFFNWLKIFLVLALEIFFYINILQTSDNLLIFINSLCLLVFLKLFQL
jgi:hypothetical protein